MNEPTLTIRLTPAQAEELTFLEVDTLDSSSSRGHAAFVDAMGLAARRPGWRLVLTGEALRYAASPTGAFLNGEDILADNGRHAMAAAFRRHAAAAQQALRGEETQRR